MVYIDSKKKLIYVFIDPKCIFKEIIITSHGCKTQSISSILIVL